jgi:hypothetical protein
MGWWVGGGVWGGRAAGKFYNVVPLLIGSNRDEGTPFNFLPQNVTADTVTSYISAAFGTHAAEVLDMVCARVC